MDRVGWQALVPAKGTEMFAGKFTVRVIPVKDTNTPLASNYLIGQHVRHRAQQQYIITTYLPIY